MSTRQKGCDFMSQVVPMDLFTPEDINEEQKMLGETVEKFMKEEVVARVDEIEKGKIDVIKELLKKAGEIGVFAIEIPKEYGGLGLDKVSALIATESMMYNTSFAVSCEAHMTIGTYPIIFFGTEEQKKKYLPDLAYARKISSYALTEPQAGSDALNSKTIATPTSDGKYYILNGTKQFITNAGIADIFIIFAKVNGKDFTAFIVEKEWGVKTGKEEEKMGQKGSSTRQVILEDVKVPAENVLGEIGKGHKVALNALNVGRMRLGGSSGGAGKILTEIAFRYASERVQFGHPIIDFPLIKWKIANMISKTFAIQSASYRTADLIDKIKVGREEWMAFEEFAVEATILKVGGSEALRYITDEAVQIHGGYGYLKEYEVERAYRDERVNRIYEGTNEINRLNIPEMIIRRTMRGRIDFFGWASQARKMLDNPSEIKKAVAGYLAQDELYAIEFAKRSLLILAQKMFSKFGEEIQNEQEILAEFSNALIAIYFAESSIARATKHKSKPYSGYYENMAKFFVHTTFHEIVKAFEIIEMRIGDSSEFTGKVSRALPKIDIVALSRAIADETARIILQK